MRHRILRRLAAVAAAAAVALTWIGCRASPVSESSAAASATTDPRADDAQNVRLVGYHDLQGRESLVVTTLSDPANGSWVYVGHHESYWDAKPKMNPITGKDEWNGTSILNVDDPSKPKLVWHIPNESNRNSRGVSVVYDYKFDGSGRDYLIRNSEVLTEGETGKDLKYQIFDITSRATDPSKITSCQRSRAHRPARAVRAAAGRSSCVRTRDGGRRIPATSMRPPANPASGTSSFRSSISRIRGRRSSSGGHGCQVRRKASPDTKASTRTTRLSTK